MNTSKIITQFADLYEPRVVTERNGSTITYIDRHFKAERYSKLTNSRYIFLYTSLKTPYQHYAHGMIYDSHAVGEYAMESIKVWAVAGAIIFRSHRGAMNGVDKSQAHDLYLSLRSDVEKMFPDYGRRVWLIKEVMDWYVHVRKNYPLDKNDDFYIEYDRAVI